MAGGVNQFLGQQRCLFLLFGVLLVVFAYCDVSSSKLGPPWLVVALARHVLVTHSLCGAEGIWMLYVAVCWNEWLSGVSLKRIDCHLVFGWI